MAWWNDLVAGIGGQSDTTSQTTSTTETKPTKKDTAKDSNVVMYVVGGIIVVLILVGLYFAFRKPKGKKEEKAAETK